MCQLFVEIETFKPVKWKFFMDSNISEVQLYSY